MNVALPSFMTADDFLLWEDQQEGVWELVDGIPTLKRPETQNLTTKAHDIIRGNIEFSLRTQVQGRCRVFSEALSTRITDSKVRKPDVTVDCGQHPMTALETDQPVVIVEILSRSTRNVDLYRKPLEYRSLPTLRHVLIVEQHIPVCTISTRRDDGSWEDLPTVGLESIVPLPAIDAELALRDVYEGVELDERA